MVISHPLNSGFAIFKMVVVILCVNSRQCSFSDANLETLIRGLCLFVAGTKGSEQEGADCSVAWLSWVCPLFAESGLLFSPSLSPQLRMPTRVMRGNRRPICFRSPAWQIWTKRTHQFVLKYICWDKSSRASKLQKDLTRSGVDLPNIRQRWVWVAQTSAKVNILCSLSAMHLTLTNGKAQKIT